ncbi:uncharacterized protein [Lepeophtheirus salmonis]|uniref:uncharacterized protein isoform X6 n=1 Tax=Lepeophtheirus salmonis TaxID=72036 RepID=UPI003AF3B77F
MFIFCDPIGLLLCLNILLTRPIHSTSSKSQLLNPLKLDLRQFRNSRQFSTMQSDGNDPADVSLIDALQKWADALETQISLTHGEVLTLRSESRTAQEEISQLKSENIRRDTELARLRMETEEVKETAVEMNALKLGFRSTLFNTTNSLDKRISALKVEINELNITSGRLQRYKMETDTKFLRLEGDLESQIVDVETKADLKLQTVRQEVFRNAGNIEKINISLAHNSQELSHQLSTLNFVQGSLGADLRSATETVMSKSNDLQTNFKNLMDDNDKIRLDLSSIRNNSMSLMMSFDDLTINVSRISDSTESLEDMLEDVVENSVPSLRKELDSLQVRVRSTESDTESTLYSLKSNLKEVAGSIPHLHSSLGNVTSGLDIRVTEIENRIRGFSIKTHESYGERIQVVEGNVTLTTDRLKRVIEFAENIKSELDLLEISLETSQKDFINKQNSLGNNFSVFSIDVSTLRKSTIELQSKVESLNYVDKNFREEFSKLSNEILSMKNTNYDVEGGIKTLKKSASTVTTTLEAIDESIKRHELVQGNQDKSISDLRTDISSLRAALTSLTNTIFILKARFSNESPSKHHSSSGSIQSLDEVYRSSGSTNLTTLTREVLFVKNELSSVIRRDMKEVKSDVVNLKSILNSMVKQFGSVMDPSRFSCSVTSDEIRTAGVITYSVCNVNSDEMMNKNNGHVTVKQSGDYLLSFTANLVSVNSKAIWCALYKQSPGSDGWKVLGMINNFQSDAAAEDDRDSASLTLISNLEAGDQIWVEWRGYGESFLYSNPYRLISFTGLLVKKDSS